MVTDRILSLMAKKIKKWMKIKQSDTLDGRVFSNRKLIEKEYKTPVDFPTCFMSLTQKTTKKVNIQSCNVGLAKEAQYIPDQYHQIRTEARVGNLSSHAVDYDAEMAPREKDLGALSKKIDDSCDSAIKGALSEYYDAKSHLCRFEDKFLLKKILKEVPQKHISKKKINPNQKDIARLPSIIKEVSNKLAKIKFIKSFDVDYTLINETRRFVNSEGSKIRTHLFRGSLSINSEIRHEDGGLSEFSTSHYGISLNDLKNRKVIKKKTEQYLIDIKKIHTAIPQESGFFPCIFASSATGTLLHENAAAHLLSGRLVLEGDTTVFSPEQLGKVVFPTFISLYDDPSVPNQFGSYIYDEEGIRGRRVNLIKKGILWGYLTDRTSAAFLKELLEEIINSNSIDKTRKKNLVEILNELKQSNGHSRAEEDLDPEPRISNLYLETNQNYTSKDLEKKLMSYCIKQKLDYGLVIESSSGSVEVEDEEMGNVLIYPDKMYRLYTNGKKQMVSRAWIKGNPHQMLNSIKALGGRYETNYGYCGADSGWVFTQEVCPSALLHNVEFVRKPEKDTEKERLDKIN